MHTIRKRRGFLDSSSFVC